MGEDDVPREESAFTKFLDDRLYPANINGFAELSDRERRAAIKDLRSETAIGKSVRRYTAELKRSRRAIQFAQSPFQEYETTEELLTALARVADRITSAFLAITRSSYISDVVLTYGEPNRDSLAVSIELRNGTRRSPQTFLSEANLDLLALLVFTELVRESAEHGQAKLLVLDDVLQSVDATFRQQFVEHLFADFPGWQLIFTVHDRLWLEQFRDVLRRRTHAFIDIEIVGWTFEHGPNLRVGGRDPRDLIKAALITADTAAICSITGRALESLSDRLSWTFPVSVVRRPGDRYTLGDHWPGVRKMLGRTGATEESEAVDRLVVLRNLMGARRKRMGASAHSRGGD